MNLKKFKKLSVWACSGLLVSLFSGLAPLNDNLCNLKTSMVVYAEGRVFNNECINSTTYNKETKTLTIPDGFTEIGTQFARLCPDLETVNIPASVEIIGDSAFWYCANLKTVYMSPDSKLRKIESGAFSGCTSLATITLPGNIKEIGQWAFRDCTSLTEINIPDNVESIGEHAFGFCTSLENISLPQEIKKIENSTFYDCRSLTSINIPDHVREIGPNAFEFCTSLREISLPSDLQLIGSEAFMHCTSFTEIRIPDKVKMVADNAFCCCCSLKQINIPNAAKIFDGYSLSLRSELRIVDDLKVSSNTEVCRYACENRDDGRTDVQIPLIANPSFPPSPQLPGIRENHETMVNTHNFFRPGLQNMIDRHDSTDHHIEHLGPIPDRLDDIPDFRRYGRLPDDYHREPQIIIIDMLAGRPTLPRPNPQNMNVLYDPINNNQKE